MMVLIHSIPMRYLLPAIILALGATASLIAYVVVGDVAVRHMLTEQTRDARAQMIQLQLALETTRAFDDANLAQELIGLPARSGYRRRSFYVSEGGRITAASESELRGALVADALAEDLLPLMDDALGSMSPVVQYDAERYLMTSVGRVCRGGLHSSAEGDDCDLVVTQSNLKPAFNSEKKLIQQALLLTTPGILAAALFAILLLRGLFLVRIDAVVKSLARFQQGDMDARVGLPGSDEAAVLAHEIDSLFDHVQRSTWEITLAERRLRATFDNNVDGMVVAEQDGTISVVNKKLCDVFGYREHELVGKNVECLMPEQQARHHQTHIERYLARGTSLLLGVPREFTGRHKNGTTFPIRIGVGEVKNGDAIQFVASIADLTPVKALESQVQRAQKMEAVGQLAGGIAHDFNNLLAIIIGNLELLSRKVAGQEALLKHVEKASFAASRGAKLANQLLGFARAEPAATEVVDINQTVDKTSQLIQRSVTPNVQLDVQFGSDIWPVDLELGQLENVLINLALNARDAMGGSGRLIIETDNVWHPRTPHMDVWFGGHEQEFVLISVSDTGCGMDDATRSRLFEPFFTTKEKGKGTGLGLSMVFSFIKQHHGGLSVYSEVGVGTTFKIYLPRSAMNVELPPEPLEKQEVPGGTETLLLVDDEADLLAVIDEFFRDLGYTVILAKNGEEALDVLRNHPDIDLVFTDVIMGGPLTGLVLAKAARSLYPDVKFLITSGFTGSLVAPEGDTDWDEILIQKPYKPETIAVRVREMLDAPTG